MGQRILIIDDEEQFSSVLCSFLEENDYQVQAVQTLAKAREVLKSEPIPDMILLDVMLGDGNGLIFMNELRKIAATKETPVIMMSALRVNSSDRLAGLEFGADDYLGKPFDLKELHIRMERIFRFRHLHSESMKASLPIPTPSPVLTPPESISLTPTYSSPSELKEIIIDDDDDDVQGPRISIGKSFFQFLVSPKIFLLEATEPLLKLCGWLAVGLASLGLGLQVGFVEKSMGAAFVGAVAFFVGFLGFAAVISWGIQWGAGFKQQRVHFSELFTISLLAYAPMGISGVLGLIYVLAGGAHVGEFTVSPLLLFPSQTSSQSLGFFLRRCDIFEWWAVALFIFGVSSILKNKTKQLILWIGGSWVALVALYGVARRFFL